MGFSWNGIHTRDLGISAEARLLPVLPEPKIITEEIPGRDGFYDFSAFNADGRVHYKALNWEYHCAFEERIKNNTTARIKAVLRLFSDYSGYLIEDRFPDLKWRGIIMNKMDFANIAGIFFTFGVIIHTQPFPEKIEE